jgi:hypothetical protein
MAFMYCKLFASLYQGTLRGKSHEILVFTNMLAHADQDGCVDKHFRAIADEVGLTVDEVKAAIEVLESPDPESRSPEKDGRRIERINDHRAWGWQIVNYGKYRAIKSDEDRRKANREAQARHREKQRALKGNITVTERNTDVMASNAMSCESAQGEGEEEGYGEEGEVSPTLNKRSLDKSRCTLDEAVAFAVELGLPASDGEACFHKWEGNGWTNGGKKIKDWKATIRSWNAAGYLPSQKGPSTNQGQHTQAKFKLVC